MLITLLAIDSSYIVSQECCFIQKMLYIISSYWNFFDLPLRRMSLILSSPKWILSLINNLIAYVSKIFSFNWFSISLTFSLWKTRHLSSAYKNRLHLTVIVIWLTLVKKNKWEALILAHTAWYAQKFGKIIIWIYRKFTIW